MRFPALLLLAACSVFARAADVDPQSLLDRHLRGDVPYWLDEPRLQQLLREDNARDASLADRELAAQGEQWEREVAAGEGSLVEHVQTRFASGYFNEVSLRVRGAYAAVVALDRRGVVAAASGLPAHYWLGDDPAVQLLDAHPEAPWAQDGHPAPGAPVRVALPIEDTQNGERLGTLLLVIDASRLPKRAGSLFGTDFAGAARPEGSPVVR